jgi:hypothetical protein
MESYITISDGKKIKNPCAFVNNEDAFCGQIKDFSFNSPGLNQKSNYDKLQCSLLELNMPLTYIWSGKDLINGRIRSNFVGKDDEDNIFWYKYEGPSPGSGQNYLYVYGKKLKLTGWLRLTFEERTSLIETLKESEI